MVGDMDFCIISPTAGLERYATLSKTHLVLAHECKDHDYLQFYIKRQMEGDFIILDNGAYENGEPEWDTNLMQGLQPNVVVLPDYPLQSWQKTWHAAIAHLDRCSHDEQEFEWCYIPQAPKGDFHGFIESYLEVVQDPRISWIGIPRALSYAITDNPLARVEFARMVRKDYPRLKLHAFGMVNGDIHELGYLAQAGVTSIDSSAPVWRGWYRGHHLGVKSEHESWDLLGAPVDFNAPEGGSIEHDWVIRKNLEACGVDTSGIHNRKRDSAEGQTVESDPGSVDGSIPF
jgi:hypothetical protein